MTQPRPAIRWWMLAHVTLVNFVAAGIAWNHVVMLVAQILDDLSLEPASWGKLWSGLALGVLIFSIPGGALGDRFGVRSVVGAGLLLGGASLLLRAAAGGFPTMFTSMVIFGMSLGILAPNLPKTLALWFSPRELGLANGVGLAGLGIGQGLAAFATPRVLPLFGSWRELTAAIGVVLIVLAGYWVVVLRGTSTNAAVAAALRESPLASIARALRVRGVWVVAICYLLYFGGHFGAFGYLPIYFTTVQGMSAATAGLVVSLGAWAFVVGSVVVPGLSDRLGSRKIVYIVAVSVNGAAVFLQAYLLGVPLAVASVVWGLSAGASVLLFVVPIEMDRVGPALAGTAVGLVQTAGFLGAAISPMIGMALAARQPIAGFAFFSACYFLSALLFFAVGETGSRGTREVRAGG